MPAFLIRSVRDWFTSPVDSGAAARKRRWGWVVAIATGLILCSLAIVFVPRLVAYYWLYWGSGFFKELFYEDVGLADSWSAALAVVAAFFYALASAYLLGWAAWRVLARRASGREFVTVFICYVFVFGLPHIVHGATDTWLNPGVCFNQRTGEPMKWYVVEPGGKVVLYDSAGFDKFGNQKRPITHDLCEAFNKQSTGRLPQLITADTRELQFFDTASGRPLVWYSKRQDGSIYLFDYGGFDPVTGRELREVTPEVAAETRELAERDLTGRHQPMAVRTPPQVVQDTVIPEDQTHVADARTTVSTLVPAYSPQCNGHPPDLDNPTIVTAEWNLVNPKKDGVKCAFAYYVLEGNIRFDTGLNTFTQDASNNQEGFVGTRIPERIQAVEGEARILYMLCPPGKGPRDGSWQCRPFEAGSNR